MARLEFYGGLGTAEELVRSIHDAEGWNVVKGRAPNETRFAHSGGAVARIFPNVRLPELVELEAHVDAVRGDFVCCYPDAAGRYPAPFDAFAAADRAGETADDDAEQAEAAGADDAGSGDLDTGSDDSQPRSRRRGK